MDKRIKSGGHVNLPSRDLTKEYDVTDSKTKKKTRIKNFFKKLFLGQDKEQNVVEKQYNRTFEEKLKFKLFKNKKKPDVIETEHKWINDLCIKNAITVLKKTAFSSREKLDVLFNEAYLVENLFGFIPTKACSKDDVLTFLKLYKSSIETEVKPRRSSKNLTKKQERLQAIDLLVKQTKKLNSKSDNRIWFGVILQCAGRIRESHRVSQGDNAYCGVYAAIKASWDTHPENVTRLTLLLAKIFLNGTPARKAHIFPKNFEVCEQFADELLVCSLMRDKINQQQPGNIFNIDVVPILDEMNIPYKNIYMNSKNPRERAFSYIQCLEEETASGMGIFASLSLEFTKLLSELFLQHEFLSSRKAFYIPNMGERLEKHALNTQIGLRAAKHAVEIQKVRMLDNGYFEVKMHTWGKNFQFELPIEYFQYVFYDEYGFEAIGAYSPNQSLPLTRATFASLS